MEEDDYVQLQELLAKLEVAVAKEYLHYENLSETYLKQLKVLKQGAEMVRKNLILRVDYDKED